MGGVSVQTQQEERGPIPHLTLPRHSPGARFLSVPRPRFPYRVENVLRGRLYLDPRNVERRLGGLPESHREGFPSLPLDDNFLGSSHVEDFRKVLAGF